MALRDGHWPEVRRQLINSTAGIMPACNGEKNRLLLHSKHWQNVMAQRAGMANEGVDSRRARIAHEEVLYRLRLAQARLKGVQARSAKAAIKKSFVAGPSGWIEGTLEADGGQQDEVIATLMV